MPINLKQVQQNWLIRERKLLAEKRRYPHLDPFVALDNSRKDLVFNPARVAGHSFLPLIEMTKTERRRYKGQNEERIWGIKKKQRPIRYAAHIDAVIYSWYGFLLNFQYGRLLEQYGLSSNILAYRSLEKSTPHFVKEVGDFVKKKGVCAVLCFDIEDFFGNVSHSDLKKSWSAVLSFSEGEGTNRLPAGHFEVYERATNFSYIEKDALLDHWGVEVLKRGKKKKVLSVRNGRYLPDSSFIDQIAKKHQELKKIDGKGLFKPNPRMAARKGIPQGLPLSGVLANMSLLDFDLEMNKFAETHHGMYRRYSDDILLIVDINALKLGEGKVRGELKLHGLSPNEKKTERRVFKYEQNKLECFNAETEKRTHLQYLGLEFDGVSYFLRSQSLSRYYRSVMQLISRVIFKNNKKGLKIVRYGPIYKKYTLQYAGDGSRNFITYALMAHEILKPFSKIDQQVKERKLIRFIKERVQIKLDNQ